MTVLVLGGAGFIGPRVIRKLVERGEDVYATDINPLPDIPGVEADSIRSARVDITDFEQVTRAIVDSQPDRIINLAYLLGGGEGNPHHQMRLNILGMDNCFEAGRLLGVDRIVYASSVAVSGQQSNFGDREINEDEGTYGDSQYATHKIFNEFQAKMFNENYGMRITGIRPANVTGPDKVRGSTDHVRCVTLPSRGEPVSFPYQDMMRLPIHVEDIAEAFVRVTLVDSQRVPGVQLRRYAHQLGRPGRDGARLSARRADQLRQSGGTGAFRQLPGGQQPSALRVRADLRAAIPAGAGDHQRSARRRGPAAGGELMR